MYLEGYLFDPPEAQEAFRTRPRRSPTRPGGKVSLTLSDPFCVERHRKAFLDLVEHHVDILFANEAEICALYEVGDFDGACGRVRRHCEIAALTAEREGLGDRRGRRGARRCDAHPVDGGGRHDGRGRSVRGRDCSYGLSQGLDLPTCGRLGSLAAAEVISHVGARPMVPLAQLAQPILG